MKLIKYDGKKQQYVNVRNHLLLAQMKSFAKLEGKIGSDNSRKNSFKAPVKTWTSSSANKAAYFSENSQLDEVCVKICKSGNHEVV